MQLSEIWRLQTRNIVILSQQILELFLTQILRVLFIVVPSNRDKGLIMPTQARTICTVSICDGKADNVKGAILYTHLDVDCSKQWH